MADVTIIGPPDQEVPKRIDTFLVQRKATFSEDYEYDNELEFVEATLATGNHDMGRCTVSRRYGVVKFMHADNFETIEPQDYAGQWIRLVAAGDDGLQTVWEGRINDTVRDIYGGEVEDASGDPVISGRQEFVAYTPYDILRKTYISRSFWREEIDTVDTKQNIGWTLDFNARDEQDNEVGNRSDDIFPLVTGTYLFGGTDKWTRLQMLQYILRQFIDGSLGGGPAWTVGGQASALDSIDDTVPMQSTQTAIELVNAIVSPAIGMDWKIVSTDGGFEIFVFSLVPEEESFAGMTIPKNPNLVRISPTNSLDIEETRIVQTRTQRYSKIRIIGNRMVICATLDAQELDPGDDDIIPATLVGRWDSTLEDEYRDPAAGGQQADTNDELRTSPRYRTVYQQFGAPDDWNFDSGFANPSLDNTANLKPLVGGDGDYQTQVRRTLNWIPLFENTRYENGGQVDLTNGITPNLLPPLVFLYDERIIPNFTEDNPGVDIDGSVYVLAERVGVHVQASKTDYGVLLKSGPNHLLAKGDDGFRDPIPTNTKATMQEPRYIMDRMYVTLAFESDQRLEIVHELDPEDTSDGTLDIEVDNAQFWYLAPHTVVDIDVTGRGVLFSGSERRVLRNDASRLYTIMAGAIARYFRDRVRGSVRVKGLQPWQDMLGQILYAVDEGDETHDIKSHITNITWTGGASPTTQVSTGFANA